MHHIRLDSAGKIMPSHARFRLISHALLASASVVSCSGAHVDTLNSSAAPGSDVGNTVLALDRSWGQAYVTGDIEFVDRILSPDWHSWTDHEGSDKAAELAEFRSGHSKSLENIIDNARVRVYGDAAVVEARERVRFRDAAGEHWLTWHITDVFIRRSAGWQVVASHQSTIPNP
jgi:ketosteroid isomerase-like protein